MFRRLPPLNALRTFECAGRFLSFKHAAEELHVTSSAVSQQIRILEDELGLPLFERRSRRPAIGFWRLRRARSQRSGKLYRSCVRTDRSFSSAPRRRSAPSGWCQGLEGFPRSTRISSYGSMPRIELPVWRTEPSTLRCAIRPA